MTSDQAFEALVDHHTAWLKAYAHFPAKVVVQNGDLSVDVEPDSSYLPGLSALPLRTFIPGAVVKVQAGTRGHVVFEGGDRALPVFVPSFDKDAGGLNELEVHAAVKATLAAPDVRLGGTGAAHPLVLGDSWKTSEDTYDTAFYAACQTINNALTGTGGRTPPATVPDLVALLVTFFTTMGGTPGTPVPTPTSAIGARLTDRLTELSGVSKTD